MNKSIRWVLAIGALLLVADSAPAQFLGLNRGFYGPYANPYSGRYAGPAFGYRSVFGAYSAPLYGAYSAPLYGAYSAPVLRVRESKLRESLQGPLLGSSAAPEIRISVDVSGKHNAAIAKALAHSKSWSDITIASDDPTLRVALYAPVLLRVGGAPDNPIAAKSDAEALPKDMVAWNFPSSFRKVHEDSTKAILVLSPQAAGTFTVVAAVVVPRQEKEIKVEELKAPQKKGEEKKNGEPVKKDEKEDKKPAEEKKKELPEAKPPVRFVTFTIQVDSVTPVAPVQPQTPTERPTNLQEALQKIKAAVERDKAALADKMTLFRIKLAEFSRKTPSFQTLENLSQILGQSRNLGATGAAILELREIMITQMMTPADLVTLANDLAKLMP
ncbi:MAG: hypothetical protein L0215_21550 [Gemmataceae bacterium]|nr:hypothetical protein [Gemmataceae bacterium]